MSHREDLQRIHTFPQLIAFLRDEMGWPIESDDFEDLTFDYTPEELGIDSASAAKIESIKRLRPLVDNQPWGIFFVKFEPKRLPVVVLRRILSRVVVRKRASANPADSMAWETDDLLFVSNFGEGEQRQISFAHFSQESESRLSTLRVLGWDNLDTPLHLDTIAESLTHTLAWPTDEGNADAWRRTWRSAFTLGHHESIRTSRELSIRLAELARAIRDRIRTALAVETHFGPLTQLMDAFRTALVHDLEPDDFADMYAQTIAYGLLSARIADPTSKTAGDLSAHMRTNPLLRDLMTTFIDTEGSGANVGLDFDELGVNEVMQLLDDANMEDVVRDFGDRNPLEDPVIHFYELFLKEYDAKKRMQRGVFYTPRPVVSHMVQEIDCMLRSEFALQDGLADISTWGEMAETQGVEIPTGVSPDQPFLMLLDPATGTGTFLVEVIDVIHKTLTAKWKGQGLGATDIVERWNEYVPRHLLTRVHGYELLMAPYAIAHLKISLKLYETGYRFDSDTRAQVFLTNALEPVQDFSDRLDFAVPALAHEAKAVNEVKRRTAFTVVLGNPPYSIRSANLTREARSLVEPFKLIAGEKIIERGALQLEKNLNDDYVKFFGFMCAEFSTRRPGIGAMITNHAFLDNPTLRGVRWNLLDRFRILRFLDLHGNSKKHEVPPAGRANENVFDIQQGVAITMLVNNPGPSAAREVDVAELWGTREEKYAALLESHISYASSECVAPWFKFSTQDDEVAAEFAGYSSLADAMPLNSTGIKTHRDAFVIDFDMEPLRARVAEFRSDVPDTYIAAKYGLADTYGWKLSAARRKIRSRDEWEHSFGYCLYRPFDTRPIYYHGDLVELPRTDCMRHLAAGDNLALLATRQVTSPAFNHVMVTRLVSEMKTCSHDRGTNCFPLFLVGDDSELKLGQDRHPNMTQGFLGQLSACTGGMDGEPAQRVLEYVYAITHSPGYRERYGACLMTEFPRIPTSLDPHLFRTLSELGRELIVVHLMESSRPTDSQAAYVGPNQPAVGKAAWCDESVWLDAKTTAKRVLPAHGTGCFSRVPEAVWRFRVGGYQVCEKWLKDRKGRTLSEDDIAHYQKIVVAIAETIRIMGEIDEVIEEHGGWPGAFSMGASDEG